jgi:predicted ATP-dependent serine protease
LRLKEAAKLGFHRAFAPQALHAGAEPVTIVAEPIDNVAALVALIAASAVERKAGSARAPARDGVTN